MFYLDILFSKNTQKHKNCNFLNKQEVCDYLGVCDNF